MSIIKKRYSWKFLEQCNLKDFSVIVPSVAVGNVGQLSCDLLISSLQMRKVATVYTAAVIPVVGYDPYNLESNNLSSSCELYACASKKIAVFQLRAPLVYKYARDFLQELVNSFIEMNVKELIILASSFASERKHVMTSTFRYISNHLFGNRDCLQTFERHEQSPIDSSLKIFGGGFASLLFEISQDRLPCILLYKYCSEGDNIPDAYDMVEHLNFIILMFERKQDLRSQLVHPVSWKLLFGRPAPIDIY